MFDFLSLNKKIQETKTRLEAVQDKLAQERISSESGGGLVQATVNGKQQLLQLTLDPSLWEESNHSICLDLIVAAVNKALAQAKDRHKSSLREALQDTLPMIPGLDLDGLL